MIITTTENIGERKIRGYCGIVYGTDVYGFGGLVGGGLISQEGLFGSALKSATRRMEERAEELGANAVIGVKVSMTSPGAISYMVVTVTGTAVIVDKPTDDEWFASDLVLPDIDSPVSEDGRFSRIMLEDGVEPSENCPIKILKWAIIYDKYLKRDHILFSILNHSDVDIEAIRFRLKLYDSEKALVYDDVVKFDGTFVSGDEVYSRVFSCGTKGALTAKIEYIDHIYIGANIAQEDRYGFIVCPNCNTKQKAGSVCKICNADLCVVKNISMDHESEKRPAIDRRIPILVDLDENGSIICPHCGNKQSTGTNCYNCLQKFILPAGYLAEDEEKDVLVDNCYSTSDNKVKNGHYVLVDGEGWVDCPKCKTRQKASAACKRCGVLFYNPDFDFGAAPVQEVDVEPIQEEVSPENKVVRPDENGCITCPHCGKYQSKKSKCFVCKQIINLEE